VKVVPSALIVDDNPFGVEVVARILERTGRFAHVHAVTDGSEALRLFADREAPRACFPGPHPPLVLLDINMPVMNGFEFLNGVAALALPAEQTPSVVIMLTSSRYDEDRARALASPLVKDYVVKPLTRARALALADRFGRPADG
jgi:CheY-like chemotaxis protein